MGRPDTYQVTQQLIREGDQVAVIYNGNPYFSWLLDSGGVWRSDPKGSGVLLRYLPSMLAHGETWNQQSGTDTIWFRLKQLDGLCHTGDGSAKEGCWQLSVLNRGEELTYTWAPAVGPTEVRSANAKDPAAGYYLGITSASARCRLGWRWPPRTLQGLFDVWTLADAAVYDADGRPLPPIHSYGSMAGGSSTPPPPGQRGPPGRKRALFMWSGRWATRPATPAFATTGSG